MSLATLNLKSRIQTRITSYINKQSIVKKDSLRLKKSSLKPKNGSKTDSTVIVSKIDDKLGMKIWYKKLF